MNKEVLVTLSGLLAGLILVIFGYASLSPSALFPSPANDAQKVANIVYAKGKAQPPFNTGLSTEGRGYHYTVYIGRGIYDMEISVYKDGRRSLSIHYYFTNRNFAELKTPADLIAHELMRGRSEIYVEEHTFDLETKARVDLFQSFTKEGRNGALEGFTRAERDLETSGVQSYLYDGKKEFRRGKTWEPASQETVDTVTKNYESMLVELSDVLPTM